MRIDSPELDGALDVEVTAKAFRALGDPVRLRIVSLLLEHDELSVSELTARLPVSQPRVSTHLKCLVGCGFAAVRREGRNAYYALSGPEVGVLVAAMGGHADAHTDAIRECLRCDTRGRSC
jgi:DNA-binding transcriptional ArsR family regulator